MDRRRAVVQVLMRYLTTDGVPLRAEFRRPFDLLAERPSDWRWLPKPNSNLKALA